MDFHTKMKKFLIYYIFFNGLYFIMFVINSILNSNNINPLLNALFLTIFSKFNLFYQVFIINNSIFSLANIIISYMIYKNIHKLNKLTVSSGLFLVFILEVYVFINSRW